MSGHFETDIAWEKQHALHMSIRVNTLKNSFVDLIVALKAIKSRTINYKYQIKLDRAIELMTQCSQDESYR